MEPSIFEAAGGAETFAALADAWHRRVMADPVVSHAFSHGFHPRHGERLAAYWTEALGGPREYSRQYGDETFVQLLPEGVFPRTADVLGANTALIGLAIDRPANRVTVVTAVDNLVKGTAGAAIQSMNIALGLPEDRALSVNGVAP